MRNILTAFVLAAALSCGAKMQISEIKTYPGAVEGVVYPELNARFRTESELAAIGINENLGANESRTYSLRESAALDDVGKFYDDQMRANGWVPANPPTVKSGDTTIYYFEKAGTFEAGKAAIAVAEIEDYNSGKKFAFVTHYIAKS